MKDCVDKLTIEIDLKQPLNIQVRKFGFTTTVVSINGKEAYVTECLNIEPITSFGDMRGFEINCTPCQPKDLYKCWNQLSEE